MTDEAFRERLDEAIDALDVAQARAEVELFVKNPDGLKGGLRRVDLQRPSAAESVERFQEGRLWG